MYIYISLGIIICICIFYYVYYYLPGKILKNKYGILFIDNEIELTNEYENIIHIAEYVTDRVTLYIPGLGYGLTFIWDMFIPNLNSNNNWKSGFNILKPIITMDDSPQISYHPKKNYLSIILKYRNNPFYAQYAEIKYDKIKLQKWSNYILIINGRNIILYIDNILVISHILPSLPTIYDIQSKIIIGQKNNNFLGKINNLKLIPLPLSSNDI